jgi:hypothetical protein
MGTETLMDESEEQPAMKTASHAHIITTEKLLFMMFILG